MGSRRGTALAFAATMALAGFLLFQVQLVLAKLILPWFGGSASTWIVCLLFFQVALLAGYAYAYGASLTLPVPRQVHVQLALLLGSLLLLPITPSEAWKPEGVGNPTWRILALLTAAVGVPYLALAATTPLLSRWLARIAPDLDPARFFAASNLGSFAGLLSYPFVFERALSSGAQTQWWSGAFALYAALFAVCGTLTISLGKNHADDARSRPALVTSGDPVRAWVGLSALGSILLLATSNAVTQWSAVVPFLWTVPLSLYLLTFVIAFGRRRVYHRAAFSGAFLLLAGTAFLLWRSEVLPTLLTQVLLPMATLLVGCMVCHGELARLQPEPARLPGFYLAVGAGGAVGGLVVALLAPLVLDDYFEHPLVLLAIAVVAFVLLRRDATASGARWITPLPYVAGLLFLGGFAADVRQQFGLERLLVERTRNFYGVVKVVREQPDDPLQSSLSLQQAGVDQGGQYQHPRRRAELVCAFDAASALGLALAHHAKRRTGNPQAPLRIGIVGLGAGMIAGLGRTGDTIRYYELNPAVLDLAGRHFTFLKDSKAKTDVLLGDGRLVLEQQLKASDAQAFDVLVLNAFRGAAPPMHLMTKEAFDIYLGHLAADGILAVNFEVEILEMAPLHRGLAKQFGIDVRWFETRESEGCEGAISWALYTKDKSFFEVPRVRRLISRWRDRGQSEVVWTDTDSNLMSIINWRWD